MKLFAFRTSRALMIGVGTALLGSASWAHVTFRPNQPLRPGGTVEISMVVPTERSVDTVRVSLEVPEAFLKAGGRLSRVDFPAGWQVKIDREDKPGEIYSREMDEREKKNIDTEHNGSAKTLAEQKEEQVANEMRRKWIKKVTFEGSSIPPDGYKVFSLEFQLPNEPGEYRFPAVQTYADGVDVSWSELVPGGQHPAPAVIIGQKEQKSEPREFPNLALILSGLAIVVSTFVLIKQSRYQRRA
jgi:Domain of unkown function (DUF1775)